MKRKNEKFLSPPSPCLSICAMDEITGFCRGCMRTAQEITDWEHCDDTRKRQILDGLLTRRKALKSDSFSEDC